MDINILCIPDSSWVLIGIVCIGLLAVIFCFEHKSLGLLRPAHYKSTLCVTFALLCAWVIVLKRPANETNSIHKNLSTLFESPLGLLAILIGLAAYTSTILTKLREAISTHKTENKEDLARTIEEIKADDTEEDKTRKQRDNDKRASAVKKLDEHQDNYLWLVWADYLLILAAVILVVTLAAWIRGVVCPTNQLLIIALLLAIVIYFALLHIRQWKLRSES
jgi:uncharacterized membrane-anchored protein